MTKQQLIQNLKNKILLDLDQEKKKIVLDNFEIIFEVISPFILKYFDEFEKNLSQVTQNVSCIMIQNLLIDTSEFPGFIYFVILKIQDLSELDQNVFIKLYHYNFDLRYKSRKFMFPYYSL